MKIFLDTLSKTPTVSLGSQALAVESMHVMSRVIPGVQFVMLSPCPEVDRHYLKNEPYNVELVQRSKSQIGTVANMLTIIKGVDAVLSVLGDGYITTHPHKLIQKSFFFKKPAVLFPSSMGPFPGGFKRNLSLLGLSKFDVVMARDTVTYQYFQDLKIKNIKLLPDIAFALDPAPESRISEILSIEKLPVGRQYIGLNVSQLLNRLFREKGLNYIDFMKNLIISLKQYDCHIILIPHQIYPAFLKNESLEGQMFGGDDRIAVQEILKNFNGLQNCSPILGDYNAREMKGIIGKCEIMINGRLHSTVGALSMCVPSVIMQYSHKAGGVMDHLGMKNCVWDINDSVESLLKIIDMIWRDRSEIKNRLSQQMVEVRRDVYKTGEIFLDVIKSYGKSI